MPKKTSDAQAKASRKWENENRSKATYLSSRRAAKSFINRHATGEDLDELKNIIEKKESKMTALNELKKLIGKEFTPHELDTEATKITGMPAFFDRNGWETAVEQESFSYERGETIYNITFGFIKKDGEDNSVLKVTDVEQL